MVNFSEEQQEIIKIVLSGKHCLVDAVAGSGKTTTVLGVAKGNATKRIIQITYNRHLKEEVKKKTVSEEISNMTVYTYHGLCVKYYNRKAYTDAIMKSVVYKNTPLLQTVPDFDILVIDEAQDMNLLFFQFVRKFLTDYNKPFTLLILGDEHQSINEFRGADRRFLTLAPEIFSKYGDFTRRTLKTSYRLTNQIASFINRNMLGEERINTVKEGPQVEFLKTNIFNGARVLDKLLKLLSSKEYTAGDIFVLSGTTRSKRGVPLPINDLENKLVNAGIPVYFSNDDEEELTENVTSGKVVFSTIHQSKGRERPIVIVYGFDTNWFTFFGRDCNKNVCPPELYVAASRSSKVLFLIEHTQSRPLDFLKNRHNFDRIPYIRYFQEYSMPVLEEVKNAPPPRSTNPTDLLRYMNEEVIYILLQIKEKVYTLYSPEMKNVAIPSETANNIGTIENISDLNGLCIPALWEERVRGNSNIRESVKLEMLDKRHHDILRKAYNKISRDMNTSDFLLLTNIYQSINTNCHFKIAQLETYNWLTNDMVDECHTSISKYIGENPVFEHAISDVIYNVKDVGEINVNCRLDAFDDTSVWEYKCVSQLQLEHFLQLIIYAWMWKQKQDKMDSNYEIYGARKFFLMNIRTEETHELDATSPYIDEAIEILFENKYKMREKISSEVFIKKCNEPVYIEDDTEKDGVNPVLMTIPELKSLCQKYGIRNTTGLSKSEIIARLAKFKEVGHSLENKTLQELYDLCKENLITGFRKKSKAELIALIQPVG